MKTLLVALDFSDALPGVVEAAAAMAKALSARMVLLHVAAPEPAFVGFEPGPQFVRDSVARELSGEHRRLQAIEKGLRERGLEVTALLVAGYPAGQIVHEAEKLEAGMIVMGSHGHGALRHLLVGSVTEGVLRQAQCPVLVVPQHA